MKKPIAHLPGVFVLLLLWGSFFLTSCGSEAGSQTDADHEVAPVADFITDVETMVVHPAAFPRELVSNGRLHALRKTRISFPFSETLVALHVSNGQQVQAGQVLALLCDKNLQGRLQQAQLRFARASLDMEDILLGRGFTLADSARVPEQVWQMAGVRSGYSEARLELQTLKKDLARTRITAPFAGQVAGLQSHVYENVSQGEVFCTLIDNSAFLVRFPVMESELSWVSTNATVEITPFSSPERSWQGSIQSINPQVDDHGRVEITARLTGSQGLMEGMNVRVRVLSPVAGQLVVPRQAVLYRDNLEVLFKYSRGKAEWTYVNVLHQNSTHYSVKANPDRVASLQPGDTVIVSGNTNLAHGSPVNLKNP